MKRVVLSVLLALSAVLPVAQAVPVQLVVRSPDLAAAVGNGADTGNGALEANFSAGGVIRLTEFVWWGYHAPGSSGTDQFEILLNGLLVGSQSAPLGAISSLDTGADLTDAAAPNASADLIRYTLQFAPDVFTLSGLNTLSVINEDVGAVWRWQGIAGSLADDLESAYQLTGDVAQQQVPEPAGLALVLSALAAAAAVRRRA